jgi:pyruvate/2-oxoglutarate/acetoin dehydrogenase E1 component
MRTVLEALNEGMHACLAESEKVYFLGEDILDPYGGAFKVARGLSSQYPQQVITTPVSEAGMVGIAVGMALRGYRPIVEIMFGDFLMLAADQLINHASKFRWMSNDRVQVPLVVRTPMGGGRGYGPTHSQTLEKHMLGVPGMRIVAVTALMDPAELLRSVVFEDDDPVLFVEHKALYPVQVQAWNQQDFDILVSKGRYPVFQLRITGAPSTRATLISYGYMVEIALEAAHRLAYEREVFIEVIALTELIPDDPSVFDPVGETGMLLTLEEGSNTLGWGAEILARCSERFGSLKSRRIASLDMPIPAAGTLESAVLPGVEDVMRAVLEMVG